ncbi:MAG: hypothetical protein AB1796_09490 [Bacillota bacterium]
MQILTVISENCNTWNRKDFTNTSEHELECSLCSAYGKFSYVQKYFIWRWEIDIPYNWQYGDWDEIKLYPTQVPIVLIKCDLCGEVHRVYPSFILEGTTLTQTALIFITFIYESSNLTWRAIPDKFCDAANKIAHSTLFKAVHGLGKSLCANNKIREAVAELLSRYPSPEIDETWPAEKSHDAHTLEHEHSLREILLPLLSYDTFTSFFFKHLRPLRTILSNLSPPISKLYTRQAPIP